MVEATFKDAKIFKTRDLNSNEIQKSPGLTCDIGRI